MIESNGKTPYNNKEVERIVRDTVSPSTTRKGGATQKSGKAGGFTLKQLDKPALDV